MTTRNLDRAAFQRKLREEEARSVISTETRPLWAVAALEQTKGNWELVIRYSHADTEAEARMTYCRARCDPYGRVLVPYKVVAIGKAIGFKALDDNGTKLVA